MQFNTEPGAPCSQWFVPCSLRGLFAAWTAATQRISTCRKAVFQCDRRVQRRHAAKVLIYESGKGKLNGGQPGLADGVYVLVRVHGSTGRTLGVAPAHHERFAFFRLHDEQGRAEMADFIAAYAGAQVSKRL